MNLNNFAEMVAEHSGHSKSNNVGKAALMIRVMHVDYIGKSSGNTFDFHIVFLASGFIRWKGQDAQGVGMVRLQSDDNGASFTQ